MKKFPLQLIFQGVDQVTKPFRNIRNSISHFQNNLKSAGEAFQKSMDKTATIGLAQNAVENFRDKAVGAFTPIIDTGMEFEYSMSKIRAITNATDTDFHKLTKKARELGATTSFSASDAAKGMQKLAMAGMSTDAITGSMQKVMQLAKATDVTIEFAGDTMTNIAGAYHMAMSTEKEAMQSMHRVANVLAGAATGSNVSVETLADTFKYVAPLAKSAGLEIEQLASMTGLLGDIGISGSQAGTTLRAGIQRFASLPAPAAKQLAELGVQTMHTTESINELAKINPELAKKFKPGDMRDIVEVLGDIQRLTKESGSGQKLMAVKNIFGAESMTGFTELIDKANASGKSITAFSRQVNQAVSDDAVGRMEKQMSANLKGMTSEMDSAKQELYLTIYDVIVPALTALVKVGRDAFKWVGDFAKENPNLTKGIVLLTAGVAGLSIVLASVLSIVSGSIAMWGAMKAMWLLSTGALAPLTASIWAMTTALLANPYTWIVIAIIAFIGILWYMWDNMDEIIQDFENGWKVFSEAFEKYTKIAGDFMSNLWDDIVIGFWDFVRKWQAIITEYGESISAKFSEIKQKVIDSLMGVFESVTSIFSSAVSKISSIVPDFIKNAFSGGTSKIEVSAKGQPLKTGKGVDGGVGSTTSTWKAWIGFDNLPKGAKVQTTKSKNVNLGMGYGGASG